MNLSFIHGSLKLNCHVTLVVTVFIGQRGLSSREIQKEVELVNLGNPGQRAFDRVCAFHLTGQNVNEHQTVCMALWWTLQGYSRASLCSCRSYNALLKAMGTQVSASVVLLLQQEARFRGS